VRIAPNWRRFVHAFCLCNLPIELQGPFRGLCLCPGKLRFPTTETGQNPKLVAPGLQKPTAGAGARIENGRRMTSKQSEEHLWMGRKDLRRMNARSLFA
jgi:hypothetical protein